MSAATAFQPGDFRVALAKQRGTTISRLPRGIRLNNPGLIVKSAIIWIGEKDSYADHAFEEYDTPEHGLRALGKLLLTYWAKHQRKTISQIISRWAPPTENDTAAYIRAVSAEVGVAADAPLNLANASLLAKLATGIVRHENGEQPYPTGMIYQAAVNALGHALTATKTEELTHIGEDGIASVRRLFELAHAQEVVVTKQPDGLFSVLAIFPSQPQEA